MKVFMVTDYFWPGIGGLEKSTAYLARALQRHLAVEILTLAPSTSLQDDPALPVKRFSTSGGAPYEAMKAYIAAQESPRAVCFFGFSDDWTDCHLDFVACARRELAEKVVFKIPSLNEFSLYVKDAGRRERLLAADYFICPNRAIQDELVRGGIPGEKTVYQPNGVPCDEFVPASPASKKAIRAELGLEQGFVFVFTGRFAARKRVDMLVEAFCQVPEFYLVLVGYFDDRFDDGSAFEIPQGGRIRVFGPVDDVLPYLHASDVFVSASRAEGMPNSMLEALACGLPALVTAIPGHLEVVRPGVNGQVFEPDNLEDLMTRVRWFAAHQRDWLALSEAARKTVVSRFQIEEVANTYRRLLAGEV